MCNNYLIPQIASESISYNVECSGEGGDIPPQTPLIFLEGSKVFSVVLECGDLGGNTGQVSALESLIVGGEGAGLFV